jgi:hypothetical protein
VALRCAQGDTLKKKSEESQGQGCAEFAGWSTGAGLRGVREMEYGDGAERSSRDEIEVHL